VETQSARSRTYLSEAAAPGCTWQVVSVGQSRTSAPLLQGGLAHVPGSQLMAVTPSQEGARLQKSVGHATNTSPPSTVSPRVSRRAEEGSEVGTETDRRWKGEDSSRMSFEDASRVGMGAGGTALPLRRERRGGEVSGQGKTAEGVRETGQGRDQVSAVPR